MLKNKFIISAIIFIVALFLRLICLPETPFFADMPHSVRAIESGIIRIQFPGYVPYNLSIAALSHVTGSILGGAVLFTLGCGLASIFYIMKTAEKVADFEAAVYAGVIIGWGVFGIYFSVVGASYQADMLAAAGFLYHSVSKIYEPASRKHILLAVAWCCFGACMRPLSSMWLFPAMVFLNWQWGKRREIWMTICIVAIATAAFFVVCSPFYKSLADLKSTMSTTIGQATESSPLALMTNYFRLLTFPFYFFNTWFLTGIIVGAYLWKNWGKWRNKFTQEKKILFFTFVLSFPYFLIMNRYIAVPGYYCLLVPVICILPVLLCKFFVRGMLYLRVACICFIVVSVFQVFVFKPVESTSLPRIIANAYYLQYSRNGIKTSTFETIASLAYKTGIAFDKIPKARMENILHGDGK